MNPKDRILDTLRKQQDPWVPYEGPYGGEGWQNVQTGEIRYQDVKPGEEEAENPTTYADEAGVNPESEELYSDLSEYFDVGESVQLDGEIFDQDDPVETEVLASNEEGDGYVEVQDPSSDTKGHSMTLYLDDLAGESLERVTSAPPDSGWESGWDEKPEDFGDLIENQTVEVFDGNSGEYLAAKVVEVGEESESLGLEVTETPEWSPEDTPYEEGDGVAVTESNDFALTAAEEVTERSAAEPIEHGEVAGTVEPGDEVLYDDPAATGLVEAEVEDIEEVDADETEVTLDVAGKDAPLTAVIDDDYTSIYEEPVEYYDPEQIASIDPEDPESNWEVLEGEEVRFEHPVHGEVSGEAEVGTDPQGYEWITVQQQEERDTTVVGDKEVAEGDDIFVEQETAHPDSEGSVFEGTFLGENDGPASGEYLLETEDGTKVGFDAEELREVFPDIDIEVGDEVTTESGLEAEVTGLTAEGMLEVHVDGWGDDKISPESVLDTQEVSATTNPEHPYYIGDVLQEAQNPWTPIDDAIDDLKIGDKVVDSETGMVTQVEQIGPDGQIKTQAGSWTDPEDLAQQTTGADLQESYEPPYDWEGDEWLDPVRVNDAGSVTMASMNEGDTVYYHDEEENEMQVAEVEEALDGPDGEVFRLDNGDEVRREDMQGFADTGHPVSNDVDPSYVDEGSVVTVDEYDWHEDEVNTFEGYVSNVQSHYGGDMEMTLITPDGDTKHITANGEDYGIREEDSYPNTSEFFEGDVGSAMDRDPREVADDIYSEIPKPAAGNYLSKADTFGGLVMRVLKEDQQHLKAEFMGRFNPAVVEDFYSAIDNWKGQMSDSSEKQKIEAAFQEALDIESRVRSTSPGENYKPPSEEWVQMASVAAELSRDYYEDVIAPATDNQLTRAESDTVLRSAVLDWAENPEADHFEVDGRALNNFQPNPDFTSNDFRITSPNVSREDIGLATDYMFNPMQHNANEDEIWVIPDELEVPGEYFHYGYGWKSSETGNGHLGGKIENWGESQTEAFAEEMANQWSYLTEDEMEVYRPDQLSDEQIETFYRAAKHAKELGVADASHSTKNWVQNVTAEAKSRGLTGQDKATYPENIHSIDDFMTDMEVTVMDNGEEIPGLVVGTTEDSLLVENVDTGKQGEYEPGEVAEIVHAPERYGPPAEVGEVTRDDIDQLDDVHIWTYSGDWEGGRVLDVPESGPIEVKRDNGMTDYYDPDRLVPEHMVPDPGQSTEDGEQVDLGPEDYDAYDSVYLWDDDGELIDGTVETVKTDELDIRYYDPDLGETVYESIDYDEPAVMQDTHVDPSDVSEGDEVYYPSWDKTGEVAGVTGLNDEMQTTGIEVDFDNGEYPEVLDPEQVYPPDARPEPPDNSVETDDGPSPGDSIEDPGNLEVGDTVRSEYHGELQVDDITPINDPDMDAVANVDLVDPVTGDYVDSLPAKDLEWGTGGASPDPEEGSGAGSVYDPTEDNLNSLEVGTTVYMEAPEHTDYEGVYETTVSGESQAGQPTVDRDDLPWIAENSQQDPHISNDNLIVDPDTVDMAEGSDDTGILDEMESEFEDPEEGEWLDENSVQDLEDGQEVLFEDEDGNEFTGEVVQYEHVKYPIIESGGVEYSIENGDVSNVEPVDGGAPTPETVDREELSMGEEISLDTESGTHEFTVQSPAQGPESPVELQHEQYDTTYLLWPDGEMEEV